MPKYNIKFSLVFGKDSTIGEVVRVVGNELRNAFKEPMNIDIKKDRDKRSSQQNKYYWKVVIGTLAPELGYLPDELHEALKIKFLPKVSITDSLPTTGKSTTKLNTKEFMEYVENITRLAAELGCYIPPVDSDELMAWCEEKI
jgi:hypothetical protein